MKDRVEIITSTDKEGKEILKFYVHCDMGYLWLFDKTKTKGVYEYFANGRSVNELFKHKYRSNKALNNVVDRLPAYIKFAKQIAYEERAEQLPMIAIKPKKEYEYDERIA